MSNHLTEVRVELIEVNIACLFNVHKSKTELVLLIFVAIAEYVHDSCEAFALQFSIFILVKYFKDPVRQEGILSLSEKAHLFSELLDIHYKFSCLFHLPVFALNHHFDLLGTLFEVAFQLS